MAKKDRREPILPIGHVVATPGVQANVHPGDVHVAIWRHRTGDWGDVCIQSWKENDEAVSRGGSVLSSYRDRNGRRFWLITEWDRSYTTALLPEEY